MLKEWNKLFYYYHIIKLLYFFLLIVISLCALLGILTACYLSSYCILIHSISVPATAACLSSSLSFMFPSQRYADRDQIYDFSHINVQETKLQALHFNFILK